MKLDKTKYEEDIMDQRKEEEERLLIVMVNPVNFPFPWAAFIFFLNFWQTCSLRPPYSLPHTAVFFWRASNEPFFLLIVTIFDFKERRLGPRVINRRLKETSGGGRQACPFILWLVHHNWSECTSGCLLSPPLPPPAPGENVCTAGEVNIRPKLMTFVRSFVRFTGGKRERRDGWCQQNFRSEKKGVQRWQV